MQQALERSVRGMTFRLADYLAITIQPDGGDDLPELGEWLIRKAQRDMAEELLASPHPIKDLLQYIQRTSEGAAD